MPPTPRRRRRRRRQRRRRRRRRRQIFFQNQDLVVAMKTVQESSKSELSSRFLSRLKFFAILCLKKVYLITVPNTGTLKYPYPPYGSIRRKPSKKPPKTIQKHPKTPKNVKNTQKCQKRAKTSKTSKTPQNIFAHFTAA